MITPANKETITQKSTKVFLIMGVSGCGKTLIGSLLSRRLNCPFFDADDYHSDENLKRMTEGLPLNDQDREPWLYRLRSLLEEQRTKHKQIVLACSALKRKYREILGEGHYVTCLVYLKGTPQQIGDRLQARRGHYMSPAMLQSQFEALEEPDHALILDVSLEPEEIVNLIIKCHATVL